MSATKAKHVPAEGYEREFVWLGHGLLPKGEAEALIATHKAEGPAFGVKPYRLTLEAEHVIDAALSDHHEDAWDELAPGAVEALQKALDAWVAEYAKDVVSYEPDHSTVVVFDEQEAAHG